MQSVIRNLLPIAIITIIILSFFSRLFYPEERLCITTDFGGSDIFQLNLPAKYSLSQSLKNNELPLWNKDIGMGFPQAAEGQIGAFNAVNLLLFKYLHFPSSYNIGIVFVFLTAALGAYCYARLIKFSRLIALFIALLFSFSGIFITHLSHFNLIQTSSFLPFIFALTHLLLKQKNKIVITLVLSLIFAQQLFAGFPQMTFITVIGIGLLVLYSVYQRSSSIKTVYYFVGIGVLMVFLASIYTIPAREFLNISTRKGGFLLEEATQFSYHPKHFITLIDPFALGNPAEGTYPPFFEFDNNIFWENSGYIGVLPLVLVLFSFPLLKRKKYVLFYWLLLIFSALMMMGKYSPIHIIYSVPPFSYFRVPARFILLFVWSLVVLCGYGLEHISNLFSKKIRIKQHNSSTILVLIIIISLTHLFTFAWAYNPIGDVSRWLSDPEVSSFLKSHTGRYMTIGTSKIWNDVFINDGWKAGTEQSYLYFRNGLQANSNLLYNTSSFQTYPILLTNRYNLLSTLINQGITQTNETTLTIESPTLKLLRANNVKHVVSLLVINNLNEVFTSAAHEEFPAYKVYEVPDVLPRVWVVYDYQQVDTVESLQNAMQSDDFDPNQQVILEEKIELSKTTPDDSYINELPYNIEWVMDNNSEVRLNVTSKFDGILVLADTYYPGWTAYIDGAKTFLYHANLNQRAILVPKGNHTVRFRYESSYFRIGALISLVANITVIVILFLLLFIKK